MENYQMSRSGSRPYNRTCGMTRPMNMSERMLCPCHNIQRSECNCRMPGTENRDAEMYMHLQHMEPAMAYVPCQKFTTTFDLGHALHVGTVFPELCRPFCGKRGGRR